MAQKSKDEICEAILKFFYDIHKSSRSMKSSRLKISTIKKGLKQEGLTEQEIIGNLDYLIQTDWIVKDEESYQLPTSNRIINAKAEFYKISDKGIDHFNGASKFQKKHPPAGINITNLQGVTVVGDGNIVNAVYSDLYRNLNLLADEIAKTEKISDEDKLNYSAEINTITSQLSKQSPDKDIVTKAWEKLKPLATIAGIVSFFEKVESLIEMLLK
ncbi:MAG: hypothetical protein QG670_1637 [Thermoproteota archaeon]|nr:hypothetical protein [Thermoproteota archaeon]